MSFISDAQENLENFWDENSNTILTIGALVGFGASLYFTAKGAIRAERKVKELEKNNSNITSMDIVKAVAPECIPTLVSAAFTIACIISNHHINEEEKIAMCGAYAMVGKSYEKYRKKVKEVAGEDVAKEIDIAMAKDVEFKQRGGVTEFIDELREVTHSKSDECLFFDPYSELYFSKTPDDVRLAQYNLNRDLVMRGEVTLWDFYKYLGIEDVVAYSRRDKRKLKKLGWHCDFMNEEYEQTWIDFDNEYIDYSVDDEPSGYFCIQPVIPPRVLEYPYSM